ncbi:hypothetical protein R8Z50_12390 [Longispora sp. K20-0274]|uniref:hypothetical protein n=1 Tax=Longispora sp. K20-0274 TaxID=3088255 RepID=UPI00399A083B
MKIRTTLVALTLAAAVPLAAGCATKDSPSAKGAAPSASATPEVPAKDALTDAMKKLEGQPLVFGVDTTLAAGQAVTSTGQADPAGKKVALDTTVTAAGQKLATKLVLIDKDLWIRFEGIPGAGDKWLHINLDKLPESSKTRKQLADPSNTAALLGAIATAERLDAGTFYGTVDLTKLGGVSSLEQLKLGDVTKTAFTAKVDPQGRLTKLSVSLGTAGEITASYTEVGKPVTVTAPPAADVVEAPEGVLGSL